MQLSEALELKVGDTVCDCRFKHLKIQSLKVAKFGKKPYDVDLVLEDESHASAVHCCSPNDHAIEDHPPLPST